MYKKIFLAVILSLFLASSALAADSLQGKLLTKPDGATQIAKSLQADDVSIASIHTVTTGKKFYLNAASLNSWGQDTAYFTGIQVYNASDVKQYDILSHGFKQTYESRSTTISFPVPLEIPEGWKIKVFCNTEGGSGRAFINGWEE